MAKFQPFWGKKDKNARLNNLFEFFHFFLKVLLKFSSWQEVSKLRFLKPNLIKYIFVKRFSKLKGKNGKKKYLFFHIK